MTTMPRYYSRFDEAMWESIQTRTMALQRCTECGRFRYPPGACCPGCLSTDAEWVPVSGRGTILSWTTFHRQYLPAYPPPHTCIAVQLEEGPIVVSNIEPESAAGLEVGRAVVMDYDTHPVDGYVLPRFRFAEGQDGGPAS